MIVSRAALLDVARRAEEPPGRVQRGGVDAARQDLAARRHREVVGAREPGERVEDDHDVLLGLGEPLRALEHELGDLDVLVRRLVERRVDDLGGGDRPLPVGDLLGPLVDEQHDQVHLGVRRDDAVRDLLEDGRLARLRRRDDHAALALADRRHHVDDALGHGGGAGLEPEPLVGEQRRELVEVRPVLGHLGIEAVHRLDVEQRDVLLVVAGPPDLAGHHVALAQRGLAHLRDRDVDVLGSRHVARRAQEAVAVGQQVEDARERRCVGDLLGTLLLLAQSTLFAHAAPILTGGPLTAVAVLVAALVPVTLVPLALVPVAAAALVPVAAAALVPVAVALVAVAVVAAPLPIVGAAAIAVGAFLAAAALITRGARFVGGVAGLSPLRSAGAVPDIVGLCGVAGPFGLVGAFGHRDGDRRRGCRAVVRAVAAVRHDGVDQAGLAQALGALDAHLLGDALQLGDELLFEGASVGGGVHEAMPLPSGRSGASASRPGTSPDRDR